jgi:hypothetical protein
MNDKMKGPNDQKDSSVESEDGDEQQNQASPGPRTKDLGHGIDECASLS